MEVPSTLSELYEVAKAAKTKKGSAGIAFYDILSFNDVCYANSTPLAKSHTGIHNTSIVYSPDTSSFEDSMLKGEMKNTLSYLKSLIDEELVESVGEYTNSKTKASSIMVDTEKYVSIYGEISSNLYGNSKYQIEYNLAGENQGYINPISYNYNGGFYVLAAETENPELTINTFVSLFYGEKKAYVASIYGAPGESYLFEGPGIKVLNESFFTKTQYPIVEKNPIIPITDLYLESLNDNLTTKIETIITGSYEKQKFIEYGLENEKIVEYPINIAFPIVYPPMDSLIYTHPCVLLLDELFHSFSRGLISIDEYINEYIKTMKLVGQQEVIDELNSKIKAETIYSY